MVNVPCVIVKFLVLRFKASPKVTVIPEPSTVKALNYLPAVVSVPVHVSVTVPV